MDPQLVQRSRYVLQARIRHVKTCPVRLFGSACKHLIDWLREHPILGAIASDLRVQSWPFGDYISEIRANVGKMYEPTAYAADSLLEHAALCLAVVDLCSEAVSAEHYEEFLRSAAIDSAVLMTGEHISKLDDAVETLRDVAIDGLFEFLDERLDARNAVLGVLRKYRHRSEWFRRDRLRGIATHGVEGRPAGERGLAIDLQEYIFDQGIEFHIEPLAASGEPDLVLRDTDGQHLIVDAKYIKPDADPAEYKRKIASGLHQVARYCHDYQEPSGYLVVFIDDTKLPQLPLCTVDGFEYFVVKDKIIYYVPVVIADQPTASRAGRANVVTLEEADLLVLVGDQQ